MEFGAMLCKPQAPLCDKCPLAAMCIAYKSDTVDGLPVKSKNVKIKKRYFNYLLVRYQSRIYLNRRQQVDIWKNLYELPLIETTRNVDPTTVLSSVVWKSYFQKSNYTLLTVRNYPAYKLTHQVIHPRIFDIELLRQPGAAFREAFIEVDEADAGNYPVPRLVETILTDHLIRDRN